jgi:biopolymer transport protein ExbD
MAKVKMKRHGFRLDMTPMVDVGFLLLTFFMLTAKFKSQTDEALDIKLPTAAADTTKLPDVNIATITIGIDSTAATAVPDTVMLFGVSNEKDRATVYGSLKLQDQTGRQLTQDELSRKSQVRVSRSTLESAVQAARLQNPAMRYAINADRRVSYGFIDDVMHVMQKYGATRFNLVTATKANDNS